MKERYQYDLIIQLNMKDEKEYQKANYDVTYEAPSKGCDKTCSCKRYIQTPNVVNKFTMLLFNEAFR